MAMALGIVMVLAVACSDEADVVDMFPGVLVHMTTVGQDETPEAVLDFRGARYRPNVGSYCWSTGGATICVDTVPNVVVPRSYVEVSRGTNLHIESNATSFTGLLGTVTGESGQADLHVVEHLEFEGGLAVIDVSPGKYTLLIEGEWEQGVVPFYFGVRVS